MRILKTMLIILVLCIVSAVSIGCGSKSDSTAVLKDQVVTVQRGNLTIDIAAAGNLALSRTEDLAIDLFYEEGTVEEVLVEEGDTVEEGQVLAKLDTEEWEDQLSALENQLTAKERDLLQAEINEKNAEISLGNAEESWLETISAGGKVIRLEERLEWYLGNDPEDVEKINAIKEDLEWAWNDFFHIASDSDEVTTKEMALELAQAELENAKEVLADTQKALDKANSKSPVIVAPFDGFITKVNVDGGDEVKKGTVAVIIADPNKFEADILVSEMDILQVKLGGEAWVQVDAIQGLRLPAKVTHISPTATIQSGVVNYKVKVEIRSLEAVMQEQQEAMPDISSGELPEQLRKAIEEGRITQEEAEEMIKQRHLRQEGERGMLSMTPEDFQLREGLTVTVSIIVEERSDVLLIPNGAIIGQGRETYVQVLKDGVIEPRSITTGISNWQYTEVIDGLTEGEQIVITQTTTTAPTTPQQGGQMPFFPGGRPH